MPRMGRRASGGAFSKLPPAEVDDFLLPTVLDFDGASVVPKSRSLRAFDTSLRLQCYASSGADTACRVLTGPSTAQWSTVVGDVTRAFGLPADTPVGLPWGCGCTRGWVCARVCLRAASGRVCRCGY